MSLPTLLRAIQFPQTTPATRQEYYRLLWAEVLLFARRTDMLRDIPEDLQLGKFIERMFAAPQLVASIPTAASKTTEVEQATTSTSNAVLGIANTDATFATLATSATSTQQGTQRAWNVTARSL